MQQTGGWPISTLLASRLFAAWERRKLWAVSQLVMAAGVLLPVIWSGMGAIIIAAVCVGGTFMVITMLGMQEAQAAGGRQAKRLIAAVTAAFAAGQLIEIGRASCRERVCQNVKIAGAAVPLKQKKNN